MATAYHLEALRRQRIIDRRTAATLKLEEKVRENQKSRLSIDGWGSAAAQLVVVPPCRKDHQRNRRNPALLAQGGPVHIAALQGRARAALQAQGIQLLPTPGPLQSTRVTPGPLQLKRVTPGPLQLKRVIPGPLLLRQATPGHQQPRSQKVYHLSILGCPQAQVIIPGKRLLQTPKQKVQHQEE